VTYVDDRAATPAVDVVPADSKRAAFASWAISQDPPLYTTGHASFGVPPKLLPDVPEELLSGALIDGHPYRAVREGFEPDGDGYKPVSVPVQDGAKPEPLTRRATAEPLKADAARQGDAPPQKQASRKNAAARKD
jgi:hypothetical protein